MMTRRRVIEDLALGGLTVALAGFAGLRFPALAQATPSPDDVAAPGPLGDVWLGSPDAKVNIVEYASMTCPHCASFHETVFPTLKSKYVDTGKVRFVLREFPLDPLATAAFMLARCAGDDKYYDVVDLLFSNQKQWAFADKPVDALGQLTKQAGFTQESFEACLKNQKIYDGVLAVKTRGLEKLGVNSTPAFFINGRLHRGALSVAELDKILAPLVGG